MRAYLLTSILLLVVLIPGRPASAADRSVRPAREELPRTTTGPMLSTGQLSSTGTVSGLAWRGTAGPDTFVLYGGPDDPAEGKFQFADAARPDWGDGSGVPSAFGPGAWIPVDRSDTPVHWHVDTFNAENLDSRGPGNHAMWCGVAADDPAASGWAHAPGYGNNWSDGLLYDAGPVADPGQGQVVDLDFFFNHDTEPYWDLFGVQYDSAGVWKTVYYVWGSNKDASNVFVAPGVQYASQASLPIAFAGNDYGGDSADRIRIRFLFLSDVGWSDEDGAYPTDGGAVQVDDITISHSLGTFHEDFEGPAPYLVRPDKSPFAGDFAEVHPGISDIDPCRENPTPVMGFMDYGQNVRNGPALDGVTWSTGGETSPGVQYGIRGNWVVNHSGGISFGASRVMNDVWSPPIQWDLPGPADDAPEIAGAALRLTVWGHLPNANGILWGWSIRSARPGEDFGPWEDGPLYAGFPVWYNARWDVSSLIQPGSELIQVALRVRDYADFFPGVTGNESTPAPAYDNVALYKYRIGGPSIATEAYSLAHDSFPANGSIDVSTPSARDALDVRFDMTELRSVGAAGDSIVFDAIGAVPGTTVADVRMVWALQTNPVFEDALRSAPGRTEDQSVVAGAAGSIWTGEVVAGAVTAASGQIIEDRYYVDLPDADLIYPGDVLHYYIRATDSDGRVSTLPTDTSGFGTFGPDATYSRAFTVRALPSIQDTAGSQPRLLVVNDRDRVLGCADFKTSFAQLGYAEGFDYDTFTNQYPYGGTASIGTAGAHGATAAQLDGYHGIFYLSGVFSVGTLMDEDIALLQQWHLADPGFDGARNVAYFGDGLTTDLVSRPGAPISYLYDTMGVDWVDADVRPVIDGQTAAVVTPAPAYAGIFNTDFVAYGGCSSPSGVPFSNSNFDIRLLLDFAHIQPLSGSAAGHHFTDASGIPITGPGVGVASVVHPNAYGVDITFPYTLMAVFGINARTTDPAPRTSLIAEVLELFGSAPGSSSPVAAPPARPLTLGVLPNPFNPTTRITFTVAPGVKGSVKVFNLRGELVRTLHAGEFTDQVFEWSGRDDSGARVASGVYLVRAEAAGQVRMAKVALVK